MQLWERQSFRGANLEAANFIEAMLVSADFGQANLSRAYLGTKECDFAKFDGANISGAILSRAGLRGASFSRADLNGVDLQNACLLDASFSGANLSGADLRGANLIGATLIRTVLQGANLNGANLESANLSGADFSRALLNRANLTNADLTNVRGLEVDSTRLVHARFSPNANDAWSALRRTYTGPKLAINLLFVCLFFAPLIAKGATLSALSEVQQLVLKATNDGQPAEAPPDEREQLSIRMTCDAPEGGAVTISVPARAERAGADVVPTPPFERSIECRSISMLKLLLAGR